jgi:hypothetical protein
MSLAFRLTARAGAPIGDAETLDEILELAKGAPPGRYRLDRFYSDPATGAFRSSEWGAVTKGPPGRDQAGVAALDRLRGTGGTPRPDNFPAAQAREAGAESLVRRPLATRVASLAT